VEEETARYYVDIAAQKARQYQNIVKSVNEGYFSYDEVRDLAQRILIEARVNAATAVLLLEIDYI